MTALVPVLGVLVALVVLLDQSLGIIPGDHGHHAHVSPGVGVPHYDTEVVSVPHGDHVHQTIRKVPHLYAGNALLGHHGIGHHGIGHHGIGHHGIGIGHHGIGIGHHGIGSGHHGIGIGHHGIGHHGYLGGRYGGIRSRFNRRRFGPYSRGLLGHGHGAIRTIHHG